MKKGIFVTVISLVLFTSCALDGNLKKIKNPNLSLSINHQSIDISMLSDSEISRAAACRLYLEHASVGTNLMDGLALIEQGDSRFNYSNFLDYARGNPSALEKFEWFEQNVSDSSQGHYQNPANFNAMMVKLCYIDNVYGGFASATAMFNYYRDMMISLQNQYPETLFVWWTMPIKTTGDQARDTLNQLVREYCESNDLVLFDIADIESHSPSGTHLTDSNSREIMDTSYSNDGGHLNAVGQNRVAAAYWKLAVLVSSL
ncbi:MAG: hypothetical protein JXR70_02705 [Spirochaetales bacterium]|nr:hypothetical protein [Spirochaetales bacterium]